MAYVLTLVGGSWIAIGLLAFVGAWFGKLPRLNHRQGQQQPNS
jgi:hypothetical protein